MVRRLLVAVAVLACLVAPLMRAEAHASGTVAPQAAAASPGVTVIVHPGVSQPSLSVAELRDILLGNQRFWSGNVRAELYVIGPPSVERTWWVERLSGMSEIQFKQYWIGQIFRGRATSAPRAVPDRRTAVALVGAVPGAIALVATGEVPSSVRVMPISGRLPAETGYPLQ